MFCFSQTGSNISIDKLFPLLLSIPLYCFVFWYRKKTSRIHFFICVSESVSQKPGFLGRRAKPSNRKAVRTVSLWWPRTRMQLSFRALPDRGFIFISDYRYIGFCFSFSEQRKYYGVFSVPVKMWRSLSLCVLLVEVSRICSRPLSVGSSLVFLLVWIYNFNHTLLQNLKLGTHSAAVLIVFILLQLQAILQAVFCFTACTAFRY